MLPLILRLSQLDADAAGALRVVSYFDALVGRRASLEALVRASATLAECPAGLLDEATGRILHVRPAQLGTGPRLPEPAQPPGPGAARQQVLIDGEPVGTVWLERSGEPGPLDAMVLERMALAAGALWPVAATLADPALVELAVSDSASAADRTRAVRLLGFPVGAALRALAVRGDPPGSAVAEVLRALGRGRQARGAVLGRDAAVVTTAGNGALLRPGPPPGTGIGVGTAGDVGELAESWRRAGVAVRFAAVPGFGPVVTFEELGAVAVLAAVPGPVVDADPDVGFLRRLAATPAGARDLAVLRAYLATGSHRAAATVLHRHHSSVSRRLEAVASAWGLDLERPADRTRAQLAVALEALGQG